MALPPSPSKPASSSSVGRPGAAPPLTPTSTSTPRPAGGLGPPAGPAGSAGRPPSPLMAPPAARARYDVATRSMTTNPAQMAQAAQKRAQVAQRGMQTQQMRQAAAMAAEQRRQATATGLMARKQAGLVQRQAQLGRTAPDPAQAARNDQALQSARAKEATKLQAVQAQRTAAPVASRPVPPATRR